MTVFTILLDGHVTATTRLLHLVSNSNVIAADGGIRHAETLGLKPSLWVGDFDSCTIAQEKTYSNIEQIAFPSNKDRTDGQLAIEAAVARGATQLILCGAFGGSRFDHSLAHITMAVALAERGIDVILTSGDQEGRPLLATTVTLDWPLNTVFSIIGLTKLEGLVIEGAKWSIDKLQPINIDFGSTHTISNVVNGTLKLELRLGKAVVIAALDKGIAQLLAD